MATVFLIMTLGKIYTSDLQRRRCMYGSAGRTASYNRGFATSESTFWVVTRRRKPSGRYPKSLSMAFLGKVG